MKRENPFYMILVLGGIAAVSALLLSLVYAQTKGPIEENKRKAVDEAMRELMPKATRFEEDTDCNCIKAYDNDGQLAGYIVLDKEKGYSSNIEVMVATDLGFVITGLKVLSQQETPGLGTQISEVKTDTTIWDVGKKKDKGQKPVPWFLARFIGKGVDDIKSVDTITGATISSSAVKRAVERAVRRVRDCARGNERSN